VRRAALLGLALAIANAASAQEMAAPRMEAATVDWARAEREAGGLPALNAAVRQRFPDVERSAVPVLLPFDVEGYRKAEPPVDAAKFMLGNFQPTDFFQGGPAGFDAVFSLNTSEVPELKDISFARPVYVLFSGFHFTYALGGPALPQLAAVKELESVIPGVRRTWHEFVQRTTFERYGVTYVAAIFCRDVRGTERILSCPQAARIADRFVHALRLAGGNKDAEPVAPVSLLRPQNLAPAFTYLPPGSLIPGTGRKPDLGGNPERTVYADLRFPLREAPAFANSQSFNNWGDCDFTGRSPSQVTSKDAPYRCKLNGFPLVFNEAAGANYQYPWRNNFCEHRRFPVGQCPGGEGHQGQDIRPSFCKQLNEGADRCLANQQDAVAAADGMILRPRRQEALLLFVNSASAHVRLRYLHMKPQALDAQGMTTGRRVAAGEVLGQIGNYDEHERGTTYHLHFDMQVPTGIGYVFVNPYMTLVASYERLIGARGTEIQPDDPPIVAVVEPETAIPLPRPRAVPPPLPAARPRHTHHVARR
jgi:murein DD-endopeptidase MepM/ murein hydrolase activator NlpD